MSECLYDRFTIAVAVCPFVFVVGVVAVVGVAAFSFVATTDFSLA
jgi:hypothetical protein